MTGIWLVVLLGIAPASAQVDIERLRKDGQDGLAGTLELDLSFRSGNVDLIEFGPALSVSYTRAAHTILVIGSGDIGWEGDEQFSNEALGHLRYVRESESRTALEGFLQANYDKSRNLDARVIGGAGIRMAIQASGRAAWMGTSYMIENERNSVSIRNRHPEHTTSHRWSSYLSVLLKLSDHAVVSGTAYFQPDLSTLGDYRALVDTRLNVGITKTVQLTTSVAIHHDSDPVDGIAETDFKFGSGLQVEW